MILGVDEVGRGPWAGPLVVGAVVLPEGTMIEGLTDSKKLSAKRRVQLDIQIRESALGWGLGWVHAAELDAIGLSAALKLATVRAVEAVNAPYHEIIIDGTINFLKETSKGAYVTTMTKADLLVPAVSAASVIAKVARDAYMEQQHERFPDYGFSSHVGYGTAQHQKALLEHGVTVLHRKSFAPIRKLLGDVTASAEAGATQVTTKELGDTAESAVVSWLKGEGYEIIERNWKTKFCEIDCIAEKGSVRYFVEVKYRSSAKQGGGIAAITPKKLKQMQFAAELYNESHKTIYNSKLIGVVVDKTGAVNLIEVE